MAENRILPLGFIDRTTDDEAIIMLTKPSGSHDLRLGTSVTLQSRSKGLTTATARVRGIITAVGYATATFKVMETQRKPDWPESENVLRNGIPVYQALPDSFTPDPARTLSREQAESLDRLAARYREITHPRPPTTVIPRQPPRNGRHPDP